MTFSTFYTVQDFAGLHWTGRRDEFSYDFLEAERFETHEQADKASHHLFDVEIVKVQCQPRNIIRGHNAASRLERAKIGEAA
jgi:hypothetical protein